MTEPQILLVENDPWRRESLAAWLGKTRHRVETEERASLRPDLVLVNLADRPSEGKSRIERLRRTFPDARLLAFVRDVDSSTVFPCLLLGVKGVLAFDAPAKEVEAALACVLGGSIWSPRSVLAEWVDRIATLGLADGSARVFTRSEQRVLDGLHQELSNKEIARRLGVTEATVKFHVTKLLKKTGTRDRRELIRFVAETVPAEAGLDQRRVAARPGS